MIKQISIKTKIGWITSYESKGKIFKVKFGKFKKQQKSPILKKFKKNLVNYLDKKTPYLKIPHKIKGNKVQKKIWNELKKIKKGQTLSYGEIAKKYNLSPRHIGKICSQNKIILVVPCHRVIRSNGNICGFSAQGGIFLKKKLLDFEKD